MAVGRLCRVCVRGDGLALETHSGAAFDETLAKWQDGWYVCRVLPRRQSQQRLTQVMAEYQGQEDRRHEADSPSLPGHPPLPN